jgi:hypothetical protein
MSEQGIVISNQRWEDLVEFAKESMYFFNDGASVSDEEVMVILSVLKNNIPFDDCESFDLIDTKVKF